MSVADFGEASWDQCVGPFRRQLNQQDEDGRTALHLATMEGHGQLVLRLLTTVGDMRGINVSVIDRRGRTALHFGAEKNDPNIMAMLLRAGVSPAARTTNGWTALHWAAYIGNSLAVQALVELAAISTSLADPDGHTAMDIARSLMQPNRCVDNSHCDVVNIMMLDIKAKVEARAKT